MHIPAAAMSTGGTRVREASGGGRARAGAPGEALQPEALQPEALQPEALQPEAQQPGNMGLEHVLLEAMRLALRGELQGAARRLCAAARARSGAVAVALELRTRTGLRTLARVGPTPGLPSAPRAGLHPEPRAPGAHRTEQALPLVGGTLRLLSPRAALGAEDGPLLEACGALLARARAEEAERAWRQVQRLERSAARQRLETGERERRRAVHDLRAPLVVIKGYTDMLLRGMGGPLTPGVMRYLERIAAAAERQRCLLEETLPPARPRQGRGLAEWLSPLTAGLSRLATLRGLTLDLDASPADCLLEGSPAALARLRREWLRTIGHTVAEHRVLALEVRVVEGGCEVETRVPVRRDGRGRHARAWVALAEQARRDGVLLRVCPGPLTTARWGVDARPG